MTEATLARTAASTKQEFLTGALWGVVAGRRAIDIDATIEDFCVELHNAGEIDFLDGIDQPAFEALKQYARWQAYAFIGRVTPRLVSTWDEMARFAVRAIARTSDGNVYEIHQPFLAWLTTNPAEATRGVALAEAGELHEPWLLERALVALADPALSRRLAGAYEDSRRLSALTALARLDHPSPSDRRASLDLGRSLLAQTSSPEVAAAVARLVLDGLPRPDPVLDDDALALLDSALTQGEDAGLAQAAFALCTASVEVLTPAVVAVLLRHLSRVTADQTDIVGNLELGLGKLSRWDRSEEVFAFIHDVVTSDENGLALEAFDDVFASVFMGPADAAHPIVLAWLEEGRQELCSGLVDLFQRYSRASTPLTIDFPAHGYSDQQIWFICRRAIGYFLIHEVVAASIVVSALRSAPTDLAEALTDLLADPLLMNYQMELRPYLDAIGDDDPAQPFVQTAIKRSDAYRDGLSDRDIPELRPPEAHLQSAYILRSEQFASASREARKRSVLADLVHTQTLLYGKRTLSYMTGPDGKRRMFENQLASFGYRSELPRQEVLDPVALAMQNYQLRHGEPR
ncbi:MAG TPA: hypothetical protein DGP25_09660 [Brevundimonas sp.]|nr:hypothetical protein [Brevundimonas sp.]